MPRRRDDDEEEESGVEYVGGHQTVYAAEKQPDPFIEFQGWSKEEIRRFLRLAAKLVRYIDHWEYEVDGKTQNLTVERFMNMTSLAVSDLFTDMTDTEKARIIKVDADLLTHIRAHPSFRLINADLTEKLAALRDGKGLEALAPFFESSAAMETAQTMFFARKPRDRNAAAAEFMDRTSPKKSRGDGNTLVVIMPPGQEDAMRRTMEIMAGTFQPDAAISAKRVRVPELPAAKESA